MSYLIAAFFGVIFGNYATTYYHRLPLGKPINGHKKLNGMKPHCSKCGHVLKFYEYLPVLSWVSSPGKCNYCHEGIDPIYTIIEVSVMLYAILLNFVIGITLLFPTFFILGFLVILQFALLLKQKKFYTSISYAILLMVLLTQLQVHYGMT
jgi:prepilin signal peptidase PulO-like enzyme (type II secretory pathway)